jgi:hypothetical protein
MKKFCLGVLTTLIISLHAIAQTSSTEVLLLGCFHFDNPGLDVAKFEDADVLSPRRQLEIAAIIEKLKKFNPDKIFVEVPYSMQRQMDSSYRQYQSGKSTLRATETHQLGYRLAALLNHPTLYAVDFRETEFPFDSLMKSAMEANQMQLLQQVRITIDSVQGDFNLRIKTHTMSEMLIHQNDPDNRERAVGWYFDLLIAGKEGNHVGSYLTSEWWRRNMVIYENIQKKLDGKEKRILVIFGSGHTALLEAMMQYNKKLQIIPVEKVLR